MLVQTGQHQLWSKNEDQAPFHFGMPGVRKLKCLGIGHLLLSRVPGQTLVFLFFIRAGEKRFSPARIKKEKRGSGYPRLELEPVHGEFLEEEEAEAKELETMELELEWRREEEEEAAIHSPFMEPSR